MMKLSEPDLLRNAILMALDKLYQESDSFDFKTAMRGESIRLLLLVEHQLDRIANALEEQCK